MKLTYSLLPAAIALVLMQCSSTTSGTNETSIPYPEPRPDSVALTFLPGLVSIDSLDFNSTFSPDGKTYYFSRSRHGKYDIYESHFNGTEWSTPVVAPFSEEEYSEADAVFSPDGKLYFISDRPRNESDTARDFDIWFIRQKEDGQWTAPENVLAVNSDSSEYYVAFAGNGNMYFATSAGGGFGQHDIYVSRFENGKFGVPQNLGPAINASQSEHDPWVSTNEQVMFFTSDGRSDSYGTGDLYYSVKGPDGQWNAAKNMGKRINTPTYEYCTYMSNDGKYFFYSSDFDIKWIDADFLPADVTSVLSKNP
ncbi:MAG: TolB family protein [Bacteroidota bacterium]